jgi:hypothetical protein
VAIAIDSTTPAIVSGASPRTTASFTAPVDSLLVALCASASGSVTHTVTNSGTGLTWVSRVKRDITDSGGNVAAVEIFTAIPATSAARTVTLTSSNGGDNVALKVLVITGAELTGPTGAVGEGSSSTANLTVNAYTSTSVGSRAVGIAADENSTTSAPTSSDTGFSWATSGFSSGIAVHKAANTATAGTSVTLNFNGTGSRIWNWAAVEIIGKPEVPRPQIHRPTTAVHRVASW